MFAFIYHSEVINSRSFKRIIFLFQEAKKIVLLLFSGRTLRSLNSASVSLLDCTIQNVSSLDGALLQGVTLHGLVISSGEIKDIQPNVFQGLAAPLQALGLPNNQLAAVPIKALKSLPELDRLDLSGNKLKSLDGATFKVSTD